MGASGRPRRPPAVLVVATLLWGVLVACSGGRGQAEVRVLAARSLTEPFAELADAFEAAHPGSRVEVSFAGTPTLVAQIEAGAPAGVFASADVAQMDAVADSGHVASDPIVFARNRLVIVVGEGNPLGITDLASLADPEVSVALCSPEVPCGAYAGTALERSDVSVRPVTEEDNVKSVVSRVSLGEVDAGVVYATDIEAARGAGEPVSQVAIAEDANVGVTYTIAVLSDAGPDARAFAEFVTAEQGRAILAAHGFEPAETGVTDRNAR